jgi:ATP-dependent DNA helicase RecG
MQAYEESPQVELNDAAQSPAERPGPALHPAGVGCDPPAAMFCGAAGEALNPAEHPFNNLGALRAQIWTEPNLKREVNADFRKEVVAFANTDGGEIFVGVENDGTILGVTGAEDVMARIGNMIRDGIKPDLTAYTNIEAVSKADRKIIRVSVLRGTKRPYHLTDKGLKPGGVFVRHGVSSVPATDEAIRRMLRESDGTVFDKARSANQDLTFIYAENYFKENAIGFTENNKRSLGLVDADGYFTNAALLLSEQCAHSVKCAVYDGIGKMTFKARKEFFGSILKQMDEVYAYLRLNNDQNSAFDGLKRVDRPDYPDYALREALLNTFIHRDYDYSGSTIVNIFDDRMEFVSLGGLVKGLTMEDLLGGVSQPRNASIAAIFYRLELIEAYGTGIPRIVESYENCLRKPVFRPAPASFVVTLPKMDFASAASERKNVPKEELVLAMIKEKGSITRGDAERILGQSKFPAIQVLNKLLEAGKIVKIGRGRSVTYRLP